MKGHYTDVWQAVADAIPDRIAVRDPQGNTWTYREFVDEAGALAGYLLERGVTPGSTVAILLHNRPEFLVTLCATMATGLTPVPLNFRYRASEVAELLVDSHAAALVYPMSLSDVVSEAIATTDLDPALVAIADTGDGTDVPGATWDEAIATPRALPAAAPDGGELWLYTGGTTGRPKGVVWGGEDLLDVQMFAIYGSLGIDFPETMDDVARIASDPATPHVVTLPLAPFMHGTALFMSMNTLVTGGTVLVTSSPRLDPDAAVRFAIDAEATRLVVAGDAVALPVVEAAERIGLERLGKVTSVLSSGMRLSDDTKRRLHRLGDIMVMDMLASTEGGVYAMSITRSEHDLPSRLRLTPNAAVLDDDRHDVQDQPGAQGILALRGTLPKRYHGDEQKTRETFVDIGDVRHVIPGDLVVVRDDHYIELLGRGSAVVNTGGEKVYPAEVEDALLAHSGVADAAVIGLPDPRFGEIVAAVVEAVDVDTDDLLATVDARLAGYKKPRHVMFVDSLERSPHGKLDLATLRDRLETDRRERGRPD